MRGNLRLSLWVFQRYARAPTNDLVQMFMGLAIFDLDNTLIAGDSDYAWGEFVVEQKIVDSEDYRQKNHQFYLDYQNGGLDIYAYLEFVFEPLSRIPRDELDTLHQQFMREVIDDMRLPAATHLLQRHRSRGDRLLIISATNRFIVEPICHSLGVTEVLASEPEIKDGQYTGKVAGIPTFQDGKVTRLQQWLEAENEHMDGAYFYSDSINDLPLLLEVDNPVVVDPDEKLRAEAVQRDWPIITLRDN